MSEPAPKPRRAQRMGQRAAIALARFCNRFSCLWTDPRRAALRVSLAAGLRRKSWTWLLRNVRRRSSPVRKQHAPAGALLTRVRQSEQACDAAPNPAPPAGSKSASHPLEIVTPNAGRNADMGNRRAAARAPASVTPIDLGRGAIPPLRRRIVVIPDCENETESVLASLRFVGLCGKRGNIKAKARGAQIVQTGDLLHKKRPAPSVVEFWERLGLAGAAADCALHLVAGNHELEIWRRLQSGARLGLTRGEQRAMQRLISSTKLFYAVGSMLFIHGYPSVNLLRHVQAYRSATGRSLNDYNRDCFQAAFDDVDVLDQYAYLRAGARAETLLHDVPNPERYYRRHGREVAALLEGLGIDLVVHGHRPERSGVQTDYELQRLLPGIRMISHDIQLRLQGLGATVIRQTDNGPTDLLFVNKKTSTPAHRSEIRRVLRARKNVVGHGLNRANANRVGQVPSLASEAGSLHPAFAASVSWAEADQRSSRFLKFG